MNVFAMSLLNANRISDIIESIPDYIQKKCGWTNCGVTLEGKHGTTILYVSCNNGDTQYYNLTVDLKTGREVSGRISALFLTKQVDELMGLI